MWKPADYPQQLSIECDKRKPFHNRRHKFLGQIRNLFHSWMRRLITKQVKQRSWTCGLNVIVIAVINDMIWSDLLLHDCWTLDAAHNFSRWWSRLNWNLVQSFSLLHLPILVFYKVLFICPNPCPNQNFIISFSLSFSDIDTYLLFGGLSANFIIQNTTSLSLYLICWVSWWEADLLRPLNAKSQVFKSYHLLYSHIKRLWVIQFLRLL